MKREFVILGVLILLGPIMGCVTEYNLATQRQETLMYGTEKEVQIGAAVARQFEEHFPINDDVDINERVRRILAKIVTVCDRQELVYTIKIIDEDKLNAVSLPGGYVYIYKGLLDAIKNDDQLAGIIGHEVGHIAAKHSIKKLQASYGLTLIQLVAVGTGSGDVAQGLQAAYMTAFFEYSQDDEFESDLLGIKYMKAAGYNPAEMASVLKILYDRQIKDPSRELTYWRTHPHLNERIAVANKQATGKLEFRDYLNIIGNE